MCRVRCNQRHNHRSYHHHPNSHQHLYTPLIGLDVSPRGPLPTLPATHQHRRLLPPAAPGLSGFPHERLRCHVVRALAQPPQPKSSRRGNQDEPCHTSPLSIHTSSSLPLSLRDSAALSPWVVIGLRVNITVGCVFVGTAILKPSANTNGRGTTRFCLLNVALALMPALFHISLRLISLNQRCHPQRSEGSAFNFQL